MHILYLHQYFATPSGRTGTRSYEFARRWVAAGHRVTVVTSVAQLVEKDFPSSRGRIVTRFTVDGVKVIALNVPYSQTMGFISRGLSFLAFMLLSSWFVTFEKGVDVVYATSTPLTVGVPAILARWLRGRRYVFEVRDLWPAVPIAMGVMRSRVLAGLLRFVERTIYRWSDAVVALSPGMVDQVRSAAPRNMRIEMVPNCADTDLFHPGSDCGGVREKRGWQGRFVCLHAGAMGRVNGLDSVVRAAEHFRDDPTFLFVLLGEGKEKESLKLMRDRLGLDNLQIVDGVPKHELPAILAASDLCLMTVAPVPILEHNSANKFFDYLSAGKPVVLNYGGWQRDVRESAEAGGGCAMGADQAFLANLASLDADQARRTAMGNNARKLAVERFNRDLLAAKALSVIVGS